MSDLSKLIIYWITVFFNVISILANARNVLFVFCTNGRNSKHYGMLLVTMFVHLFYNLCSTAYTAYMIAIMNHSKWSYSFIFWSGSLMFSASLSLVCLNLCIVVDRILAITRPVAYGKRLKAFWLGFTLILLITVFVINFAFYVIARLDAPTQKKHFSGVVDFRMVNVFYIIKTAIEICNIPVTASFIVLLKRFLRDFILFSPNDALKNANQIVFYEMLVDVTVIIVPTIVTVILNYMFDIVVTTLIGSYPNALYVMYTTFCALLLAVKLKKSNSVRGTSYA